MHVKANLLKTYQDHCSLVVHYGGKKVKLFKKQQDQVDPKHLSGTKQDVGIIKMKIPKCIMMK